MPQPFVHLHLHSKFSVSDSTLRLKQLIERSKQLAGTDVLVCDLADPEQTSRLVLLCQDREGYLNLCKLLSLGYQEGQHQGIPHMRRDWISQHSSGLIALSGGREGDIGQALLNQHPNQARQFAEGWIKDFPNRFYIEIQRTGREQEKQHERHALKLSGLFSDRGGLYTLGQKQRYSDWSRSWLRCCHWLLWQPPHAMKTQLFHRQSLRTGWLIQRQGGSAM